MANEPTADADEGPGGLGGANAPAEPGTIRDTRLAERAIRECWPIPDKARGPLIARLLGIALDKATSPREATSAAKAVLGASKLNLESIAASMKAREHEELAARLEELERRVEDEGRDR